MTETPWHQHAVSISAQLGLAVQSAAAAGKIVRDNAGKIGEIEQKDVGDLVSEVDLAADRAAQQVLRERSELPILSEELNSEPPDASSFWIVDPLDASSAYLMQLGPAMPSVLVALREDNQTRLGVVYFPLTEEWFYAQRGRGAWRDGKRLVCDTTEQLGEVWVEMNQYGNAELETDYFARLRNHLRSADGARLVTCNAPYSGVAMRIATGKSTLAAAIHDNNPRHAKQSPWDIAAPQIILEEAGGVFVNPDGKRTDPFQVEPIIVARSRALADSILELGAREAAY